MQHPRINKQTNKGYPLHEGQFYIYNMLGAVCKNIQGMEGHEVWRDGTLHKESLVLLTKAKMIGTLCALLPLREGPHESDGPGGNSVS